MEELEFLALGGQYTFIPIIKTGYRDSSPAHLRHVSEKFLNYLEILTRPGDHPSDLCDEAIKYVWLHLDKGNGKTAFSYQFWQMGLNMGLSKNGGSLDAKIINQFKLWIHCAQKK